MSRESRLRLIGLYAALIVSTVQGLTPDAHSLVSPWVLEWFHVAVMVDGPAGGCDRIPVDERPSPLGDGDLEGPSAQVVVPGESLAPSLPGRRLAESSGRPFASSRPCRLLVRPGSCLSEYRCRPSALTSERIASLCRLTC